MWACPVRSSPATCTSPAASPARAAPEGHQGRLYHRAITHAGAPIFKNCDYGIVGDVNEILPLLTAALDTGEKQPAPPMVKMKRPRLPKPEPIGKRYVCGGCGYELHPELATRTVTSPPARCLKSCRRTGSARSARSPRTSSLRRNGLSSVSKGGFLHALCENCYRKSLLGRRQ